jgi:3-hydroxybutyryl-CoA dehydrogenase
MTAEAPPRTVVIGGGTMGAGIAAVLAASGYDVQLVEAAEDRAAAAISSAAGLLDEQARRDARPLADAQAARARLTGRDGLSAVAGPIDLAVEAVPERAQLKRELLAAAEDLAPTVLATNTSSISIDALAAGLRAPERFLGLHFFNPVAVMALVEVVVGTRTSEDTRKLALDHVRRIGKEPVVIGDAPGFATSRLGLALGLEAIRMVEQGVASPEDIDRAMELGYRHPVGPLRLTDIVGLDVRLDIARHLAAAFGPRFEPPALLEALVADGRLGRKSGHGFYRWQQA